VQNIKLGMPLVTYGANPYSGEFYVDQNVTMAAGWCNAAYGADGWGAMSPFFGAMTMATGELHDMHFPVLTLGRQYITDSGGPGKWRGGLGAKLRMKALAPMFMHTYVIGTRYPMRGANGGMDGSKNKVLLREGAPAEACIEETAFEEPMSAGHIVQAELGGGGGWGDPLERDPQAVLEDVLDEYVSLESARRDYGVVINEPSMQIDLPATAILREQLAKQRQERRESKEQAVRYLSPEWAELCARALNEDKEFARLAADMTIELNNVIENCPDGKTRFLYWKFEGGRLLETVVGLAGDLDRVPFFTTIASYETFMKMNTAKLNVETAVMEGLLRFEGDLTAMMQYVDALNRFTEVRKSIPTEY
jgi:hypothetical protein